MVDIHIRDISDPAKRKQLVDEILTKTGNKALAIEVHADPQYRENGRKLTLLGDVMGKVNYVAKDDARWYGAFASRRDEDELLLKVSAYIESDQSYEYRNQYGRDEMGWKHTHHEADPGRIWYVVVKIKDLINITQQASMEPVVVKKEIEA